MKYSLVGQLPRHLYVWIDPEFILHRPTSTVRALGRDVEVSMPLVPAVWFGLVSYPARTWGCTVMLESGAVYRNLPPHAICFRKAGELYQPLPWTAKDAQTWNCYGQDFTTIEYDYLSELDCLARCNGKELPGRYLFTAAPIGDGFSAYPEQTKEFAFVKLDNGRLTIQPTNHVVFREKSFTDDALEFPTGLKRQMDTYYCE